MQTLTTVQLIEINGGNLFTAPVFTITPQPIPAPTAPFIPGTIIITFDPTTGIATCG